MRKLKVKIPDGYEQIYGFLFSFPAILLFTVIILIPVIMAVVYSFSNYALAGSNANNFRFIGFENYLNLLKDDNFFNSIKITLLFTLWSTIYSVLISFFISAITFRCHRVLKSILAIVFLLGSILPMSVSINLFVNTFHFKFGLLNYIPFLKNINWFSDHTFTTLIICNLWINIGWVYLLYSSVFESIPKDLLEIVQIDRLDFFQKIRYIYLPYLKNVIMVTILFSVIIGLKTFMIALSLTNGGPDHKTEFLSLYAYTKAFRNFDFGYGTSVSITLLILIVIIGIPLSIFYRKLNEEEKK